MSADNWAICPKCKTDVDKQRERRVKDAQKAYGKAPPDEYLELLKLSQQSIHPPESLREDYEIGVDQNGGFAIRYRASCNCGFRFSYTHTEQVP